MISLALKLFNKSYNLDDGIKELSRLNEIFLKIHVVFVLAHVLVEELEMYRALTRLINFVVVIAYQTCVFYNLTQYVLMFEEDILHQDVHPGEPNRVL